MQAGEPEVLNALRVHADALTLHADDGGEWANVDPYDAFRDNTLVGMLERTFLIILGTLANKEFYKPIDDDHGKVKMSP
jgi:hypothetical protein